MWEQSFYLTNEYNVSFTPFQSVYMILYMQYIDHHLL